MPLEIHGKWSKVIHGFNQSFSFVCNVVVKRKGNNIRKPITRSSLKIFNLRTVLISDSKIHPFIKLEF